MKFRLHTGTHADTNNAKGLLRRWFAPDVVESNERLDKLFPNKFKRIPDSTPATAPKNQKGTLFGKPEEPDPEPEPEEQEVPDDDERVPLGADVTGQFPAAEQQGMLVFKKGSKFFVADTEDAHVALNENPLKKGEVLQFIREFVSRGIPEDDPVEED